METSGYETELTSLIYKSDFIEPEMKHSTEELL